MVDLPEELLIYHIFPLIFTYIEPRSLFEQAMVCKSWFRCAMAVKWRHVAVGIGLADQLDKQGELIHSSKIMKLCKEQSGFIQYLSFVKNFDILLANKNDWASTSQESSDSEADEDFDDDSFEQIRRLPGKVRQTDLELDELLKTISSNESLHNLQAMTIQAGASVDMQSICNSELFQKNFQSLYIMMEHANAKALNLEIISKLRNLRSLVCTRFEMPQETLLKIIQRNLVNLKIYNCPALSDYTFKQIADTCPDLQMLSLYGSDDNLDLLTNDGLDYLVRKCKNLTHIFVSFNIIQMRNSDMILPIFATFCECPLLEHIELQVSQSYFSQISWSRVAKYLEKNMEHLKMFVVNDGDFVYRRSK